MVDVIDADWNAHDDLSSRQYPTAAKRKASFVMVQDLGSGKSEVGLRMDGFLEGLEMAPLPSTFILAGVVVSYLLYCCSR